MKAFDAVPHERLLKKIRAHGISGKLYKGKFQNLFSVMAPLLIDISRYIKPTKHQNTIFLGSYDDHGRTSDMCIAF